MSDSVVASAVVGVDLRRPDPVIDRASRLAVARGARMTLIHVLAHGTGRAANEEGVASLRALAAVILARRADTTVEVAVRSGDPARELARFLEERGPDLFLVGRGRAQGLLGALRPTIAERVASRSEVPVLSVGSDHLSAYQRSLVAIESPAGV